MTFLPNDFLRTGLLLALLGGPVTRVCAQTAEDSAELARHAARADLHLESIEAFQQAIATAPARRREWLVELADQLTWAERPREAIPLYREAALTTDPAEERRARRGLARALSWDGQHSAALTEYARVLELGPNDREVRLERARVLTWANRLGEARVEYERFWRDHPEDLEARRALGRIQSWRGRYRVAAAQMQELLAEHPHDREATTILAESLEWMGRGDRAERVLRAHLAADPDDDRAADRLAELELRQRTELRLDWRESHQSDDLRITSFTLGARQPLADGRSALGIDYGRASYRPPNGPVSEILVERPGLLGRHRISDSLDWNGALYADVINTRGAAGDHVLPTYETYFTYWPDDTFRIDIGSSRWTFDSEEALREGLNATQGNASIDLTPNDLTRFSGRASFADYSDGNQRSWWQFEAEHRIWRVPRVALGYRYTGFDFAESGRSGYYNPDLYHSNELLLRSSGWFGRDFRWDLRSAVGYEHEIPGDSRLIWNAGASVAWELQRSFVVELAYDFSSSKIASPGGFERGTGRFSLRYSF
jgi:tetratricopeptide (TPR) repeat protein